jgi:hypothetical protein
MPPAASSAVEEAPPEGAFVVALVEPVSAAVAASVGSVAAAASLKLAAVSPVDVGSDEDADASGASVKGALTSPEPVDEAEDEVVVSAEPEVASVVSSEASSVPVSSVVVSSRVFGSVESDTTRDFLLAMMALLLGCGNAPKIRLICRRGQICHRVLGGAGGRLLVQST